MGERKSGILLGGAQSKSDKVGETGEGCNHYTVIEGKDQLKILGGWMSNPM